MKYLVTGGAGFIGSHVVEKLVELGNEVVAIDNMESGSEDNIKSQIKSGKVKLEVCDVVDSLDQIFKDNNFAAVFHLAALPRVQYSIDFPDLAHRTNVDGMFNVLDTARRFGVKKFIFTSSSSVYGDQEKLPLVESMIPNPMSPYALHKLIGEQYCSLFHSIYGMETISLRYFNVYGPRQNPNGGYANLIPKLIKLVSENLSPTINNTGEQTRDFVNVKDVALANIAALECQNVKSFGQAFNIGTGVGYSVNNVVQLVMKIVGNHPDIIKGPQVIEPKDTLADVSKTFKILGWKPSVDFEEGLKDMILPGNKV